MNLASHIVVKAVRVFNIFFLLLILSGCNHDDKSTDAGIEVTSFDVVQNGDVLIFTYTTIGDVEYVEIFSTSPPSDGSSGAAPVATSSNGPAEVHFEDIGLQIGDVGTFYIRAVGSNNDLSAVFGPELVTIAYCDAPNNLHVENGIFSWYYYPSSLYTYYEIEYGSQGFALGDGTTLIANGGSTDDLSFVGGETYDIYIRCYCSPEQGFSSWTGPLSYLAEENQNLCIEPTNVSYTIEYNSSGAPVGVQVSWDDLGNDGEYEYTFAANNQAPNPDLLTIGNSATIHRYGLTPGVDYDFYVRTKCNEGATTSWVGPLNISI